MLGQYLQEEGDVNGSLGPDRDEDGDDEQWGGSESPAGPRGDQNLSSASK